MSEPKRLSADELAGIERWRVEAAEAVRIAGELNCIEPWASRFDRVVSDLQSHIAALEAKMADVKKGWDFSSQSEITRLDEFWGLVYPKDDPTGWEYPAQVYRHVRDLIDEKNARIEQLEAEIERKVGK